MTIQPKVQLFSILSLRFFSNLALPQPLVLTRSIHIYARSISQQAHSHSSHSRFIMFIPHQCSSYHRVWLALAFPHKTFSQHPYIPTLSIRFIALPIFLRQYFHLFPRSTIFIYFHTQILIYIKPNTHQYPNTSAFKIIHSTSKVPSSILTLQQSQLLSQKPLLYF